ncbi:vWA domain-containing protein [Rhizobium sp. G187]|uniref:vWA domain-containing protein n=1 Tax=Rhizobium sp. G187 TaxID=3451352 RepID=UPI003EE55451
MMTGTKTEKRLSVRRMLTDRGGNFAMMTAILLPVTLATVGVAMDMNNLVQVKSALQDAADSAALSAASALANQNLTDEQAIALAKTFYATQYKNTRGTTDAVPGEEDKLVLTLGQNAIASVNKNIGTKLNTYDVTINGSIDVPTNAFTQLLGYKSVKIAVEAKAESSKETKSALSMYLVLDRSGSMSFTTDTVDTTVSSCVNYTAANWAYKDVAQGKKNYISPTKPCYVKKIAALKTAAAMLLTQLTTADPLNVLVRVGAVSYNDSTQAASGINWGVAGASAYITALPLVPTGGTDASGGMKIAYDALKSTATTETNAHTAKGNERFSRYIVLMTDGEMTGNSSNWNSNIDSQVRTHCANAKADGIEIFTVAFMAPTKGKELLSACASSASNYYEPSDMSGLVKAFEEIGKAAAKATTRLTN